MSCEPSVVDKTEDSSALETTNLLKYCDYFKFHLVEELVLEDDYSQLPFGKCSLIGKLIESADGDFLLENIKVPTLPSKYALAEGTVTLRLLRFNYFGTKLHHGRYCEVCGELFLLDLKQPSNNKIPLTSRGVQEQLLQLADADAKAAYLKELLTTHKPALNLWLINETSCASELLQRNLEIRMLQMRIRQSGNSS